MPYVPDGDARFLKTVYRSRKAAQRLKDSNDLKGGERMSGKPVPAPGHDAPFLDAEEERSIREIEAAIDKGEIQPPSAERLDALRQEWREVLRETR